MTSQLEQLCIEKGLKLTDQRRVIAQVLSESSDHPDVEQVYNRATNVDSRISIATVYRTVKLFEEANILERHDFGDGRARYEEASEEHHDHLIDVNSGEVIEFCDEEIEQLQRQAAARLGYRLVGHRLELYAVRDTKLTQSAGAAEAPGSSGSAPGSASGGRKIDAASRRKPE
jgi:Fur family ferric uptake transcriptional regulator